jgi:hypothetical protein
MLKSMKSVLLAATAIAAVLIPAAASARPIPPDPQPYSMSPATLPAVTPAHQPSVSSRQSFSWHDAAFGAGAMLVLVGVGGGAMLMVRRRSAVLS